MLSVFRNNYKDYSLESRLHFRIQAALHLWKKSSSDWSEHEGWIFLSICAGVYYRLDLVLKWRNDIVNERQKTNFAVNVFYNLCGLLLVYLNVFFLYGMMVSNILKTLIFCIFKRNFILIWRVKKSFKGFTGTIKSK